MLPGAIICVGLAITPAIAFAAEPVSITRQPGVALGASAQNILNLSAGPQALGYVLDGQGNHVAVYPSVRIGVDDTLRQLQVYQAQGFDTVRQIVTRWVSNPTVNLAPEIKTVAAALGVEPDRPIDVHDPSTAATLVWAMQPFETGKPQVVAPSVTTVTQIKQPAFPCDAPSYDTWGQQACRDAAENQGEPPS